MQPALSTIELARPGRANPPVRPFSERARLRLRIAARLLPSWLRPSESLEERFDAAVLDVIDHLDVGVRERLRAQVDWVEAYERTDAAPVSNHGRPRD